MSLANGLLVMGVAGAIGGAVNAFVSSNGFLLPRRTSEGGARIWQPGFIGTFAVGAFAAAVNWGLYGPFTNYFVFGSGQSQTKVGLTLASVVTAALVGFAGGRWLTNEVDKKLWRAAATEISTKPSDASAPGQLATATPAGALEIAEGLEEEPTEPAP